MYTVISCNTEEKFNLLHIFRSLKYRLLPSIILQQAFTIVDRIACVVKYLGTENEVIMQILCP